MSDSTNGQPEDDDKINDIIKELTLLAEEDDVNHNVAEIIVLSVIILGLMIVLMLS